MRYALIGLLTGMLMRVGGGPGRAEAAPRPRVTVAAGQGAEIATDDNQFALQVRARLQARAELENRATAPPTLALSMRRLRLVVAGHLFGPAQRFYIQLGLAPRDQIGALPVEDGSIRRTPLRDARIELDLPRAYTLLVGQYKVPFSRQRVMSSGNLEMVDRGVTNEEFNLDRDVGLTLRSKPDARHASLRYQVGVFAGRGRNPIEAQPVTLLYVGRVDVQPLGELDESEEGDLSRNPAPRLGLGVAYAFHHGAVADRGTHGELFPAGAAVDYHHATLDGLLKWRGIAVQVAAHARYAARTDGDVTARDGVGGLVQASYAPGGCRCLVGVRYAAVRSPGAATASTLAWRDEATGSVGWFPGGHTWKVQLDYSRVFGRSTEDRGSEAGYVDALWRGADVVRMQVQIAL